MRRAPKWVALRTLVACLPLLLLLLVQQGDAFYLANYQQQQQQSQAPTFQQSPNALGFLPNGYNLAAGSPLAIQPPQYQQQQQQQQLVGQPNQLPASNTNQLYSSIPSDSAPSSNNINNNELDDANSNKQFDSQYSRASSSSQSANQQIDPRLDRIGPTSMSDREATPVFRFTGQALNSTSVKLVWSMTTGYQADFFEIRYGPIPDTESKIATLNGTARELTVSLLSPNEMYHFKLQAFINGSPVWKPLLQVIRTHPAGNTKPGQLQEDRELTPLGVKAEAKSNQTIQLSWIEQERPSHLTNAKRVNYIRYHVDPSLSQEAGAANGTNSSTPIRYHYLNTTEAANRDNRIIIQKLKPATEYAFAVRTVYFSPDGKKALKTSPFSMDTLAKTFDLEPSPPRNFSMMPVRLSAEESRGGELIPKLELTWAAPESPNGQLKGYVILYAHDLNQPDEKWARIYVNDSSIFNWYVSNLRPGASYYFKMRAINQRGQSGDTETRMFMAPPGFPGSHLGHPPPIPANNILMLIVICLVAILFVLFLVVSRLFCRSHSSNRKLAAQRKAATLQKQHQQGGQNDKLVNGYGIIAPPQHQTNSSSSTVMGRVGTLARRSNRQQAGDKPDLWISPMEQQAASSDVKSNMSDKSNTSDNNINMQAMVSIRRDSPQQFTTQTTQLAPILPEYRFAPNEQQQQQQQHQLMQQLQQQQSHYHTGHQFPVATLGYDQMDNATASALMTLTRRQQQQLQKYQFQFASAGPGGTMNPNSHLTQASSPHQQPPPPPPLNIEQQQAQQQQQQLHNQPLYGTHGPLNSTRSLRLHRPPVYDPVSGSFVQPAPQDPPNYNSHLNSMLGAAHHQLQSFNNSAGQAGAVNTSTGSNTLQFHHPHSTSTLMSRRSTNTLRSFQSAAGAGSLYGQLGNANTFMPAGQNNGATQGPQLLQNHQAVINQLNDSTYPSMPLKHVSAVRPQIMSSLEDHVELELAEKQAEQQQQQQQQQQDQNS